MSAVAKTYEKTGKPFRNDTELLTIYRTARTKKRQNQALYELWDKYEQLRFKMRNQLRTVCKDSKMRSESLIEEYDSRAWEKFLNSVNGVRLEDWEHLRNPSMWISLWGYWRSMNRDIIKEYMDWAGRTVSTSTYDGEGNESKQSKLDIEIAANYCKSAHDEFEVNIKRKIFNIAIESLKKELSPKQKLLIASKQNNEKIGMIYKKLNINKQIYDDNMTWIKQRLNHWISHWSKKMKYEVSYEDYLV